jgi:DNA-binding response OmpR family regulator
LFATRIPVIEDERTLPGFIEHSLRTEGYAVTVAHDGESGEAAALTGDYALVLLVRENLRGHQCRQSTAGTPVARAGR